MMEPIDKLPLFGLGLVLSLVGLAGKLVLFLLKCLWGVIVAAASFVTGSGRNTVDQSINVIDSSLSQSSVGHHNTTSAPGGGLAGALGRAAVVLLVGVVLVYLGGGFLAATWGSLTISSSDTGISAPNGDNSADRAIGVPANESAPAANSRGSRSQAVEVAPNSTVACPSASRPDQSEIYQVGEISDLLNIRSTPNANTDGNILGALPALHGPIRFSDCVMDDTGRLWWTDGGGSFVAKEFIEPLRPRNDCSAAKSPLVDVVYRVSSKVPEHDPLAVRSGPGTSYSVLTQLAPGHGGLAFRGCTLSVEGGAWWLLVDGGYVSSNFVEV